MPSFASKTRFCLVPGCGVGVHGRGLCGHHYWRRRHHGDAFLSAPESGEVRRKFERLALIETDDCVVWDGDQRGSYGRITIDGKTTAPHIVVCERHYGERPTPQHEAAHRCGARPCMNYRHVRWATPKENAADKVTHGTIRYGERSARWKLTDAQVAEIRRRYIPGEVRQVDLAVEFGVSQFHISQLVRCVSRRYATDELYAQSS